MSVVESMQAGNVLGGEETSYAVFSPCEPYIDITKYVDIKITSLSSHILIKHHQDGVAVKHAGLGIEKSKL